MFDELIKIIKEKQKFIITTHVNPDGDGLGSEIAFSHLLKSLGKEVHIINQDPILENYSFIDPEGNIFVYNRERDHKIFASSDINGEQLCQAEELFTLHLGRMYVVDQGDK